ncbi:MAG: phosphoglycerate kinase [Patescibacteria group bacterium]|mgnify:CR=1 FL=1
MLRTLKQLKNLKGKRVLLRVDFNVPLEKGKVADDTRIKGTLPTIKFLLRKKAKVIIMSHLGRPDGKHVSGLTLDVVGRCLQKLLGRKVQKLHDCIGASVEKAVLKMEDGQVVLLENVRFHAEEEACEPGFTKTLASLGEVFVNDAFGTSHRKHASTAGIAKYLPSYGGFLIEREIKALEPLLHKPKKPVVLLVGGAKITTKIGLIKNFFGKADSILIGGALANTFLKAEGYDIGKSLYEPAKTEVARELLMLAEKKRQKIILPEDAIVADTIGEDAQTLDLPLEDIEGDMKILDIGSRTQRHFMKIMNSARTVIWNGPMGLYEFTPFAWGTRNLARSLALLEKTTVQSFIGGGDTIDALNRCGISLKKFTFISTGGGAMLEYLEGKKLPGIEVLQA